MSGKRMAGKRMCRNPECSRSTANAGLICKPCLDRGVKPIPDALRQASLKYRGGDPFVRSVKRGNPVLTLAGGVR